MEVLIGNAAYRLGRGITLGGMEDGIAALAIGNGGKECAVVAQRRLNEGSRFRAILDSQKARLCRSPSNLQGNNAVAIGREGEGRIGCIQLAVVANAQIVEARGVARRRRDFDGILRL